MIVKKGFDNEKQSAYILEKVLNEIIRLKITDLNEIKEKVAETIAGKDRQGRISNIINTILQTKLDGEKIILRDGIFSKPLKVYMCYSSIPIRCLTNDHLFIRMLADKIMKAKEMDDRTYKFYSSCSITSMTITSENFEYELPAMSGLIQDYDQSFSAICSEAFAESPAVNQIIQDKPERGVLTLYGEDYQYFGTSDLAVICSLKLTDDEIVNKVKNMKFFRTEKNKFKLGEKVILAKKKLKYMYQSIGPENFCPAYWFSPVDVKCNFLFELEIDYNDLFDFIYDGIKDELMWPTNLCYWDTLNQCFDFLAVVALTHSDIPDEKRTRLTKYATDYHKNFSTLTKMKTIQLRIERAFHDFLDAFLNNSGYERFIFLAQKIDSLIVEDEKVKKLDGYVEAVTFLNNLPFTSLINNQLKDNRISITLKELSKVLKNYIKGTNATNILGDIRQAASQIVSFLPNKTILDARFPFIVAGGPLFGELITFNNKDSDLIFQKIDARIAKEDKAKKKKKKEIEEKVNQIVSSGNTLVDYFKKYYLSRPKNSNQIDSFDYEKVVSMMRNYFSGPDTTNDYREIFLRAMASQDPSWKFKKDPFIETFIKDFKAATKKRKKGKKVYVSQKFYDTAKKYGYGFDIDVEDESSDEEMEDVKDQSTKPALKTRSSVSSKAKNDDMDVEDDK